MGVSGELNLIHLKKVMLVKVDHELKKAKFKSQPAITLNLVVLGHLQSFGKER